MIVKRNEIGEFITPDGKFSLSTHDVSEDCDRYGCCIHSPTTDWPLANAPYNWRTDRGIMERMCEHGIGHPDIDSAHYFERRGMSYMNTHGCDGCCLEGNASA